MCLETEIITPMCVQNSIFIGEAFQIKVSEDGLVHMEVVKPVVVA